MCTLKKIIILEMDYNLLDKADSDASSLGVKSKLLLDMLPMFVIADFSKFVNLKK